MKSLRALQILIALVASTTLSQAAPVIQVVDGKLAGAQGVAVGSLLYDVEFVDGTCATVFGACTPPAMNPFGSIETLEAAGRALLDTVLIDGPLGQFDSRPELTRGCQWIDLCVVFLPFLIEDDWISTFSVNNVSPIYLPFNEDNVIAEGSGAVVDFDTSTAGHLVFARWTMADSTPIPAPATLPLALLSLVCVAAVSRTSRVSSSLSSRHL